jgi:hypothetical protein
MTAREKVFWIIGMGRGDLDDTYHAIFTMLGELSIEEFNSWESMILDCAKEIREEISLRGLEKNN